MSDKNKQGQLTLEGLLTLYRQKFPQDYQRILSIYESEGKQRAIEEIVQRFQQDDSIFQRPTGSGLSQFLNTPTIALSDITATDKGELTVPETEQKLKVPTYSESEIKQNFDNLAKQTLTLDDVQYQVQRDIMEAEAENIKKQQGYDFWDAINLASKNVVQTITEAGIGTAETFGLLLSKGLSEVNPEAGYDFFKTVRTFADLVRAYTKIKYNITSTDELLMQTQLDQQITQGITQAGLFILGSGVGGAFGKVGQVIGGGLIASTEATQEAEQAFDKTNNLDTAFNTFILDLPATALDYATDRFVFFKGLGVGKINKVIDFIVGTGIKGQVEGMTEAVQQAWQNTTAKELYDYNRSLLAGIEDSYEVGSIVGMFLGGATTLVEMKLQQELTPEERALLEGQRKELYSAAKRILSNDNIEQNIRNWEKDNLILHTDPVELKKTLDKARKEEQLQATRGVYSPSGKFIGYELGSQLISQGKLKAEQSQNLFEKTAGIAQQAIGHIINGDVLQVPEKYKPLVNGIETIAKTGVGIGFLYWLSQTNYINDPTVLGSLMIPTAALSDQAQTKLENVKNKIKQTTFKLFSSSLPDKKIIGTATTKEGIDVSVINPKLIGFNIDAIDRLNEGESINISDVFDKDLIDIIKRLSEAANISFSPHMLTIYKSGNIYTKASAGFDQSLKRIIIYPTAYNRGDISRTERLEYLKEAFDVLDENIRINKEVYDIKKWLETLNYEDIRKLYMSISILHELQHLIDSYTEKLSVGANKQIWTFLPNDVLNEFVTQHEKYFREQLNQAIFSNYEQRKALYDMIREADPLSSRNPNVAKAKISELVNKTKLVTKSNNVNDDYSNEAMRARLQLESLLKYLSKIDDDGKNIFTDFQNILRLEFELFDTIEEYEKAINEKRNLTADSLKKDVRYLRWDIENAYDDIEKRVTKYLDNQLIQLTFIDKATKKAQNLLNKKNTSDFGREIVALQVNYFDRLKTNTEYYIYEKALGEQRARTTEALYLLASKEALDDPKVKKAIISNYRQGEENSFPYITKREYFRNAQNTIKETEKLTSDIHRRLSYQVLDELQRYGYTITSIRSTLQYGVANAGGNGIQSAVFSLVNPKLSIADIKKREDRINLAVNISKILTNENINVPPIGDIYAYLEETGRDIIGNTDDLPNIVNEIREFAKTREVKKDPIILTHFADLVGEKDNIQEIILDPAEAWKHPHSYSAESYKIKVPRIFFYPVFDIKQYRNSLEAQVVTSGKVPFQTFLPIDQLYAVDNLWNLPVRANPMKLDFSTYENTEASFKLIHQLGYKGAIVEADGKPIVVTFEPIKAYRAPKLRIGITAHKDVAINKVITNASKNFAEKFKKGDISREDLDIIVEGTRAQLQKALRHKKIPTAIIDKLSPAVAAFFGDGEGSTVTEITTDIGSLPYTIRGILEAGEALNQDAVHIFTEGIKPKELKYGEVLPDFSQWQPMVTVTFPSIGVADVIKISDIFSEVGFARVTVSPTEKVAFLYNVEGDANGFTEKAAQLSQRIKRDYPEATTTITDIQLWSIGKPGSWGTVATYEKIKSVLPTESEGTKIVGSIIDNNYKIKPTLVNMITGEWDNSVIQAQQQLLDFIKNKNLSEKDASKLISKVAVGNAIENNSTVINELQSIVRQNSWLLPISREAFEYSKGLVDEYNPFVTLKEAREINNILSEFYSDPKEISKKAGNVLVTTDRAEAEKHGKAIYISLSRPLDIKTDPLFLKETEIFLRETFGDIAFDNVFKDAKGETLAEKLEYIGLMLSNGNPRFLIDNLALKHLSRTASTYNSSLTFIQRNGDVITAQPINLSYNLEGIMRAKADNNPYSVLELLFSLNNQKQIGEIKLDDDIRLEDLNLTDEQVKTLWERLTDGVVDPNKLLDVTSILSGLIKLAWNLVKVGFQTIRELSLKLNDFIGKNASSIVETIIAPLHRAIDKQKQEYRRIVDLTKIFPDYDARRLSAGVKKGATIGYTEENLAEGIRNNLDRIVEAMNSELAKDKRYRIPMDVAKETVLKLLESGEVQVSDIDNFKRGVSLPAEYTIAYRIIAENNLLNSVIGLSQLKEQYGGIDNIPPDIFNLAITNLQTDVSRWAKVRATISESARTVRLATEKFENYLDVIGETLQKLGIDDSLVQLVKSSQTDKSTDWIGLFIYNFLLSHPFTHLANLMGNSFNLLLNIIPEGISDINAFKDAYRAIPKALLKAKVDIAKILMGAEREVNKFFDMQNVKTENIKSGLWKLLLPTTWLSISDAVFRNYATQYKTERLGRVLEKEIPYIVSGIELLQALATNPEQVMNSLSKEDYDLAMEALEYADYYGQYITYQLDPESSIGEAFVSLSKNPITRFLVFFAKTPLNILKQGMHYTPFYALKVLGDYYREEDITAITRERYSDASRRTVVGSTLMLILFSGVAAGLLHITGDEPKDEFERELWAKQGFKPYHIYVKSGDQWRGYSYISFEPMRFTINLYRGLYELYLDPKKQKYISDEDILKKTSFLMAELWNNINDASFMTGINEWYRTQESPKSASEYLERLIANVFVPNIFTFQRELPPEIRDIFNMRGKEIYITENLWDRIKAKVGFGLQEDLTPRYDFYGDKIYNKFERFPFVLSETGKDPDSPLLDWLDKHRLRVPAYKKDPVIDSYGDFPSLKEKISQKIGVEMRQRVKELYDAFKDYEDYYDALKEKARKAYGDDDRVEIYKTTGQIRIDAMIQEKINKFYTLTRNKIIAEEFNMDIYKDLEAQLKTLEEEAIPEIEIDKYSDKIPEIEFQEKNDYFNKEKGDKK